MATNVELWTKLEAFQLDDPQADFQFTDRLAHENGWSKAFARGASEEYKRFVYLAATGTTPVTPSDVVDQVWHLHLTFTRSYWDDLCAKVLGRPLHHGPTKGGVAEDTKYRAQYAQTLARYQAEFGVEAPEAYWPHPDARFASAPHQRWVDRRTHFVIPKPRALWGLIAAGITAIGWAGTAIASENSAEGSRANDWVFVGIVIALIFLVAAGSSASKKKGKRGSGTCGTGCGSGAGKDENDGGEGGEGGGDGGGDGGGGCGGGGCGS